jgi:NitT/TauT family transport system substrate-binding protein
VTQPQSSGLTGLGKFISVVLVAGLIALGVWIAMKSMGKKNVDKGEQQRTQRPTNPVGKAEPVQPSKLDAGDLLAEMKPTVPGLAAAVAYVPKDNVIDIELSEYAGYSGLIVANGGLAPNANSVFAKKHNFQVRIKLSEEESWNALNSGKMAASATTADVLAAYGRQLHVTVPAQIGFSRGADGLVVRSNIRRFNDLKGKVVASQQFTESDFFVRYLAHEAGLEVKMMESLSSPIDPERVNLIYCVDPEKIGALMKKDMEVGSNVIAGAMTWAPTTTELVAESGGKLRLLVTNKNLLIIADVLIVNRGFAEKNPEKVAGLVDGLLTGNQMVRDNPQQHLDVIGKAFKWDRAETQAELQKVHLSNLPENLAFFKGGMSAGGSFAGIYQSAVLAYGSIIPNPVDSDRFMDLAALQKTEASGAYKAQVASVLPIATAGSAVLEDPLLSKDIRFYFNPDSSDLDMNKPENLTNLASIKRMLDVSPGSRLLLRGHVDNANIEKFRREGEEHLRTMSLRAMDLSKRRAAETRRLLIEREKVDKDRIETVGRGWEEPAGTNSDFNRRVEVQWFTLE